MFADRWRSVEEPFGSGVWGKHEWVAPQLEPRNIVSMLEGVTHLTRVPGYAEADLTVQWDVRPWAELEFVGQNLLHDRHPEFSGGQPNLEEYDRSVFAMLTLRRR